MAQSSGPLATGSTADRQMTDALWRDLFGDQAGVIDDVNGTSYALALPSGSDIVSVGSATQTSLAKVAGFVHRISAGSTEPITIPAAVGSTRTDIIALRYDPSYTGQPGPVRLVRIAGSSSAIPAFDDSPPGIEELPLWAITRAPGQLLSAASTVRLFPRIAPSLDLATGAPLPTSVPLGTVLRQGSTTYRRVIGSGGTPVWQSGGGAGGILAQLQATGTAANGSVPSNTYTTILSIPVTVPPDLTVGQQIVVKGTVFAATAAGVGAAVKILNATEERSFNSGSISGDLNAFRYDTNLTAGNRTYSLQIRSTVANQPVTWRVPHLEVKVV